jgi:hypothetical protein
MNMDRVTTGAVAITEVLRPIRIHITTVTVNSFPLFLKMKSISWDASLFVLSTKADGSYYYSNPDGSTYYNSGTGSSTYTAPNGTSYSSGGGESSNKK